jgi:hypothetical protein
MEGLVQRTCCCHESGQAPELELKGIDDCCGALISKGEHPAAATTSAKVSVDTPMLSLAATPDSGPCRTNLATSTRIPLARGSPNEHGPPLFVLYCSYLN